MTRGARFALGVAFTALLVLAIVLLVVGLSGGSGGRVRRLPPPARLAPLPQTFANAAIGVTGRLPRGWAGRRGPGAVAVVNRDGSALIEIYALSNPSGTHELMRSALASVAKSYRGITLKLGRGTILGGLRANSRVIYARNRRGVPIRILVAGARGRHLGYIVEAFTARRASVRDLEEAQEIVLTLRLSG